MSYKFDLLTKLALERLSDNPSALFVDVRSKAEHKYVGYPENSILIPWIDEPRWKPNPDIFHDEVVDALGNRKDKLESEVILICRSVFRSNETLKCLQSKGFNNVAHVASGFEGDLDENDHRGNLNG